MKLPRYALRNIMRVLFNCNIFLWSCVFFVILQLELQLDIIMSHLISSLIWKVLSGFDVCSREHRVRTSFSNKLND